MVLRWGPSKELQDLLVPTQGSLSKAFTSRLSFVLVALPLQIQCFGRLINYTAFIVYITFHVDYVTYIKKYLTCLSVLVEH
jgi:hypothetical protein